jgi:CheY-like chemotaxis protein
MSAKKQPLIKSILLVDDCQDDLAMYKQLLNERIDAHIVTTNLPGHAEILAESHFFDMVIMDVTMSYKGTQFGGFELYKSLLGRYGHSSLMVYSQLINDELLKQYGYAFNFFEKGPNILRFVDRLVDRMVELRGRQFCFVAMPFDPRYDKIFSLIRKCLRASRYECLRVDQVEFTDSIVKKIFEEIRNCKFAIFVATDRNPNAFYECGYAVALNKEVITLTDEHRNLPFDIRDRHAIAYGSNLDKCGKVLTEKLHALSKMKFKITS